MAALINEAKNIVKPLSEIVILAIFPRKNIIETALSECFFHELLSLDIFHVRRHRSSWHIRAVLSIGDTIFLLNLLGTMRARISQNTRSKEGILVESFLEKGHVY